MIFQNKSFYPTPARLISRMIAKIKGHPEKILEPSAGKGNIIEKLSNTYDGLYDISAIEIDEELQATLRGKGIKIIDTDFLNYSGPDKFDLIIGNPPFDDGDKHLLKALEIIYRGQIIFLLNAETIRNPHTNTRKELVKKLNELQAEIEYIPNAFKDAERPTGVEVALINIIIERSVEDDLFTCADDKTEKLTPEIEKNYEVSTGKTIEDLVAEYNQIVQTATDTIVSYYRNYKKIGAYLRLNDKPDKYGFSVDNDMTGLMQGQLNDIFEAIRTDFWRRTLDLKEVRSRLTAKKQAEFEHQLRERCHMDFTEGNIRQFVLNLIKGHEKTLVDAVIEIFDRFTIAHSFSNGLYDDNIHYFNGWKTNKAFKVNKKIIIPVYAGHGSGPFVDDYSKKWEMAYGVEEKLRDIDIVMNYFDGAGSYLSIANAIEAAFERGESSKIESTYFTITCYKKGTIHLTFNDEDILRRFNVVACKGKRWLPHDYGTKAYKDFDESEKAVVESFEGALSYSANLNKPLLASYNPLQLAASAV